jgi:hypothetical protein
MVARFPRPLPLFRLPSDHLAETDRILVEETPGVGLAGIWHAHLKIK